MMISCKEAGRLVSESQDRRLSRYDLFRMRFHLAMCMLCRRFSKHIEMLRQLSRVLGGSDEDSPVVRSELLDASLSPDAKTRIKEALAKEG